MEFLLLESENLPLEQKQILVFLQNFQIPCVFCDREFVGPFSPPKEQDAETSEGENVYNVDQLLSWPEGGGI